MTNVNFIHASTHPVEMRTGVKRMSSHCISKVINEEGHLKPVVARNSLPQHRQFRANQQTLMFEYGTGTYHLDNTSSFSLRPPELLIIKSLELYLKWFSRHPTKEYKAHEHLQSCPWIDGACYTVLLRKRYIHDFFLHIVSLETNDDHDTALAASELLLIANELELENNLQQNHYSNLFKRFVAIEDTKDTIVVFTHIKPECFTKFIYHLLLTMGKFETELDFQNLSPVQSLIRAKVASSNSVQNVKSITKKYVQDQLGFLPLTAKQFGKVLQFVEVGLTNLFNNHQIISDTMPLVTHRAIQESATAKLENLQSSKLMTLVHTLQQFNLPGFSDVNLLIQRKYVAFKPCISQISGQSQESFEEQKLVLAKVTTEIDNLTNPRCTAVKFPIILGSPGAGKTHLLLISCVYALTKRLRTMIVSLTSERARQLGGEHIHLLFGLPVSESHLESAESLVDKCLYNLHHSPVKLAFLKSLDVVFFEEISLLSSQMYAVIDMVMRCIRRCERPMGGLLLIASGDHRQLRPIHGRGIWLNNSIYMHFAVFQLNYLVRSRNDRALQNLIYLLRKVELSPEEVNEVMNILYRNISTRQFLPSWDKVPDKVLRVVGKRSAEEEVTNEYLQKQLRNKSVKYVRSAAKDEVEGLPNHWSKATEATSKQLDKHAIEVRDLYIFLNSIMKLSYNNTESKCRFSQGQLAVITKLPDTNLDMNQQKLEICVVPPGIRNVDVTNLPQSWQRITLKRRFSVAKVVGRGRTRARRNQWPLKYYVSSTVHKIIGETLPKIATQISTSNPKYTLWEREQLLVIFSRVSNLSDILFVGNKCNTYRAIYQLLHMSDPVSKYIDTALNNLNRVQPGSGLIQALPKSILTTNDTDTPTQNAGFVYMVVSQNYPHIDKLGHCINIRVEMQQLNQTLETNENQCRPWHLLLFITGFEGEGKSEQNTHSRQSLLEHWNLIHPPN